MAVSFEWFHKNMKNLLLLESVFKHFAHFCLLHFDLRLSLFVVLRLQ